MSNLIAVVGDSGQGKSTSIEYLNPSQTFIINIGKKPLPFRLWKKKYTSFKEDKMKGNYLETSDTDAISKVLSFISLKREEIKNVVIDDSQYITAFELLDRALDKGWDKYSEIAAHFFEVIKAAKDMRENLNVICMFHDELEEQDATGVKKRIIKTSSRFIKEKLKPEGLFTYVFFTDVFVTPEDDITHFTFITNDGIKSSAKTPRGCFEDRNIPNDLKFVIDKIQEYNEG
jgi:hypothetical protein